MSEPIKASEARATVDEETQRRLNVAAAVRDRAMKRRTLEKLTGPIEGSAGHLASLEERAAQSEADAMAAARERIRKGKR